MRDGQSVLVRPGGNERTATTPSHHPGTEGASACTRTTPRAWVAGPGGGADDDALGAQPVLTRRRPPRLYRRAIAVGRLRAPLLRHRIGCALGPTYFGRPCRNPVAYRALACVPGGSVVIVQLVSEKKVRVSSRTRSSCQGSEGPGPPRRHRRASVRAGVAGHRAYGAGGAGWHDSLLPET